MLLEHMIIVFDIISILRFQMDFELWYAGRHAKPSLVTFEYSSANLLREIW